MCKQQAITNNRLHPIHVTPAEVRVMRRDARATHRWAVVVLDHLIEIAGRPAGGLRCAPEMLTAMRLFYEAEHVAKRVPVRIGTRDGVSVHFLQWAESRLPGGPMSSNLLRLIRGSLARWREANPGVVPEVDGAGIGCCAV